MQWKYGSPLLHCKGQSAMFLCVWGPPCLMVSGLADSSGKSAVNCCLFTIHCRRFITNSQTVCQKVLCPMTFHAASAGS